MSHFFANASTLLALTLPTLALAQTEDELSIRASSKGLLGRAEGVQFEIDPKLASKIYESSVNSTVNAPVRSQRIGIGIVPTFGQMAPSQLVLRNEYYEVDYQGQVDALNGGGIRAAVDFAETASFSTRFDVGVSYFSRQAILEARSTSGVLAKDDVVLTAGMAVASVETEWRRHPTALIRPLARAGVGVMRIAQSGNLDGIEQSSTAPVASASLGTSLFPAPVGEQGFDGVVASVGYDQAFAEGQEFSCVRWDVGARFTF